MACLLGVGPARSSSKSSICSPAMNATLCSSLERCIRSVVDDVVPAELRTAPPRASVRATPQASTPPPEVWIFHVLIGDGIITNNAAAKRLWACLQERGLGSRVRYFLAVIVCGTHQTGLAAKSAVTGRAAAAAERGKLYEDLAGVAVRLFKSLINDYFDEFVTSINAWVVRELTVLQPLSVDAADAPIHQAATQKMQTLYTQHVLPDELVALWNNGLHRLSHVVGAGEDPVVEKPRVVQRMVQFIVKRLMLVDSSPTLSRFFTFRNCTDALLTMLLIGMPPQAFVLHRTKPKEQNQKRLALVLAFCSDPGAVQLCKRNALAFQGTGGVEALVSTNPVPNEEPPIVRLCNGEADTIIRSRFRRILASIAALDDPDLDVGAATGVLLAVVMELTVRMRRFQEYPAALCRMSKRWYPESVAAGNALAFLATEEKQLDIGVGLPLHKHAWQRGSTMNAAQAWLLSPPAQEIFNQLAVVFLAHSMSVERRHAELKQWEGSKVIHLSQASGNAIHNRYLRWQQRSCDAIAIRVRDV